MRKDFIELVTFDKPKYMQQIIAVKGHAGSFNTGLFDAVELFIDEPTNSERLRVKDDAKEWAEKFVAQMNSAIPK
jgi:hypothetical protein